MSPAKKAAKKKAPAKAKKAERGKPLSEEQLGRVAGGTLTGDEDDMDDTEVQRLSGMRRRGG